jgi:hypothetical protein
MAAPVEKAGITTLIMVNELIEQKRKLKEILSKYGVEKSVEIEEKIKKGEISEHPSYEDYLSALAYERNILELKKQSRKMIEEI